MTDSNSIPGEDSNPSPGGAPKPAQPPQRPLAPGTADSWADERDDADHAWNLLVDYLAHRAPGQPPPPEVRQLLESDPAARALAATMTPASGEAIPAAQAADWIVLTGQHWSPADASLRILPASMGSITRVGQWQCRTPLPALAGTTLQMGLPVAEPGLLVAVELSAASQEVWLAQLTVEGEREEWAFHAAFGLRSAPPPALVSLPWQSHLDFRLAPPATDSLWLYLGWHAGTGRFQTSAIELPVLVARG